MAGLRQVRVICHLEASLVAEILFREENNRTWETYIRLQRGRQEGAGEGEVGHAGKLVRGLQRDQAQELSKRSKQEESAWGDGKCQM